jgi:hypothetical protein
MLCMNVLINIYRFCLRFRERGRVFSRNEVLAFQIGPGGLFFTGDAKGEVKGIPRHCERLKQPLKFWL